MDKHNKKVNYVTWSLVAVGVLVNLICLCLLGADIVFYTLLISLATALIPLIITAMIKYSMSFIEKLHIMQAFNIALWLHVVMQLSIYFLADESQNNLWLMKVFIVISTILTMVAFSLWSEADIDLDNETTYIETTMPLVEAMYMLALYIVMWIFYDVNRVSELTVVFLVAFAVATAISTNLWPIIFPRPNKTTIITNIVPQTNEPPKPQPIPEPIHDSINLIQKELHALKTIVVIFIVLSSITMALLVGTVIGVPTLVRAWSDQMEAVPMNSTVVVEQETSKYNPNSGAIYTADNA